MTKRDRARSLTDAAVKKASTSEPRPEKASTKNPSTLISAGDLTNLPPLYTNEKRRQSGTPSAAPRSRRHTARGVGLLPSQYLTVLSHDDVTTQFISCTQKIFLIGASCAATCRTAATSPSKRDSTTLISVSTLPSTRSHHHHHHLSDTISAPSLARRGGMRGHRRLAETLFVARRRRVPCAFRAPESPGWWRDPKP